MNSYIQTIRYRKIKQDFKTFDILLSSISVCTLPLLQNFKKLPLSLLIPQVVWKLPLLYPNDSLLD